MKFEIGTKLYRYHRTGDSIAVSECEVVKLDNRVMFIDKDSGIKQRSPRIEDLGTIDYTGKKVWLTERNDELATRLFIEHIESKNDDLRDRIKRNEEMIAKLKEL